MTIICLPDSCCQLNSTSNNFQNELVTHSIKLFHFPYLVYLNTSPLKTSTIFSSLGTLKSTFHDESFFVRNPSKQENLLEIEISFGLDTYKTTQSLKSAEGKLLTLIFWRRILFVDVSLWTTRGKLSKDSQNDFEFIDGRTKLKSAFIDGPKTLSCFLKMTFPWDMFKFLAKLTRDTFLEEAAKYWRGYLSDFNVDF